MNESEIEQEIQKAPVEVQKYIRELKALLDDKLDEHVALLQRIDELMDVTEIDHAKD